MEKQDCNNFYPKNDGLLHVYLIFDKSIEDLNLFAEAKDSNYSESNKDRWSIQYLDLYKSLIYISYSFYSLSPVNFLEEFTKLRSLQSFEDEIKKIQSEEVNARSSTIPQNNLYSTNTV